MPDETIQHKPRILVVDDEECNRLLLERILAKDYIVDMVANGHECLDKVMQHDYDAVLLDLMMPVLNGIDTLKIIREELDLATLPVIIVSAQSDNNTVVKGMELGANDFIAKPIDPRIVFARVKTQIQLKQLSDERKMVTQALQEANDMKLRMMEIASHDLKNPLNNLALMMTILGDTVSSVPELPNFTDMANENIENMVQIIDDFLSANDCMTRKLAVKIGKESSKLMLESVLSQYALVAEKKCINIVVGSSDDVAIIADRDRTLQVMNNLVSNAIKYTPPHGTITIRTMHDDNVWRLEVQDTGAGIPEEEQQYLFKAFSKHQISTTPTAGESSTGLGLWIAAEMMSVQNGAIGMYSPPDGGCCFWIELPVAQSLPETMSVGA